jgi:hypothetical protein
MTSSSKLAPAPAKNPPQESASSSMSASDMPPPPTQASAGIPPQALVPVPPSNPLSEVALSSHLPYVPPELPSSSVSDQSVSEGKNFSVGDLYGCKETNFKSTVSSENAKEIQNKHHQMKAASKRECNA